MLTGGTIFRYLFGHVEAIKAVAASRASIWTGIILVFLTSIARNYDQTHINEDPIKWLFGALLFSLVSGSWLFLVSYCIFVRREMGDEDKKSVWLHWPQFMGLFWMTAPVAWLYAIPVERFMESVPAAKANVVLLQIVSLWRVLLMARVLQVTCKAPFSRTLLWVLFPAAVEVLLVFLFGGYLAQSIMRGMGGLRNSPAEDVVLNAMGNAFGVSFWSAPVLLLIAFFWRTKEDAQPLPMVVKTPIPMGFLVVATTFWVALAIPNQKQVWLNAQADVLLKEERFPELLAYLSAHERKDFAPSRSLPPKMYERESFTAMPKLLAAMDGKEAPWVRELIFEKMKELEISTIPRWVRNLEATSEKEKLEQMSGGYMVRYQLAWKLWIAAIRRLQAIKEGKAWLDTKPLLLQSIAIQAVKSREGDPKTDAAVEENKVVDELLNLLKEHGIEAAKPAK